MPTVSDAIIKDHRELEQFYTEVTSSSDPDHQQRYGNQFTWELARHSVAEELVVYPAFEQHLGQKGHQMAEEDRKEHHRESHKPTHTCHVLHTKVASQVKELLKEFQDMPAESAAYVPKLKELWSVLSQHIKEEEEHDLPALESALKSVPGESETMAKKFENTKMFVPTRSHPSAGENPYFESAIGLLAAPIDRLSDLFRKYPGNADYHAPATK